MNMNSQSGRSLIEMLGVLAVAGMMSFGAVKTYQTVRLRQERFIATEELRILAENTKLLYSGRKNYSGVSTNYLIKAGAVKTSKIFNREFRVEPNEDGTSFAIIFDDLDMGDCAYFATVKLEWAAGVAVNGFAEYAASLCASSAPNRLEFIVK